MNKAISTIPGASIIQRCYNIGGFNPDYSLDNVYCGFFGRSAATGQINSISLFNLNLGQIKTSGFDFVLRGTVELGGDSAISFDGSLNYVDKYAIATFPGNTPIDLSGSIGNTAGDASGKNAAYPKWRAQANIAWRFGSFTLGAQYRFIDSMIDSSAVGVPNSTAIGVPSYHYVDLNAEWRVDERMSFRLGVVNLGDRQPPVYTSFQESNTYPGLYDLVGRAFYAGISARF